MLPFVYQYRVALAHTAEAAALAAMSREYVEAGLRPAWDAPRIAWHIRHADSVVLTARAASVLAGFAIMRYADDTAHLNLLAVDPAHRRRGVARALIGWLEASAGTAGTFTIGVELREHNEAARAFYKALGYRELTRIPGYYQGCETAIRMSHDLRCGPATAPPAS